MLCAFRIAMTCCALVFIYAGPAEARRVALVIGNGDYKTWSLQNPVNDATAVAEALKKILLDSTTPENLGLDDFRMPIYQLLREATGTEVGVVFFSGLERLICHRSDAVGEGASCIQVFYSH